MKIDTEGLKIMYRDGVRRKAPSSKNDCPSPKKMLRLLKSRSSSKESTQLIDHISRCGSCFSEFGFLSDVFRQEKDFVREVEKRIAEREKPGLQEASGPAAPEKRPREKAFIMRFSWRPVLVLAILVFTGFFMAKFVFFQPAEKFRTGSPAAVKLVKPARENVAKGVLSFEWQKVDNSEYYILELYDQALAPIWKSDKLSAETAALPKELSARLEVDRSYFWAVTAFFSNGDKIASRLERFVLKK